MDQQQKQNVRDVEEQIFLLEVMDIVQDVMIIYLRQKNKMEIINLTPENKIEAIRSHLGTERRLLSASKTMYREKYPNHKIFFNACLFDSNFTQLWWGDIDFDLDKDSLQMLANYLKETIYITIEQDYRWNGLKKSQINNSAKVVIYEPIKK